MDIYLLVTTYDTENPWFENVEKMMNTGIKKIKFDTEWVTEKNDEGKETKKLKQNIKIRRIRCFNWCSIKRYGFIPKND